MHLSYLLEVQIASWNSRNSKSKLSVECQMKVLVHSRAFITLKGWQDAHRERSHIPGQLSFYPCADSSLREKDLVCRMVSMLGESCFPL